MLNEGHWRVLVVWPDSLAGERKPLSGDVTMPPRLSPETERRLKILFTDPQEQAKAAKMLEARCGNNFYTCENAGPAEMEQVRFAALECSCGSIPDLEKAIKIACDDWRDLLFYARFLRRITHKKWLPTAKDIRPPGALSERIREFCW
jgi:hypothetical protein